MILHLSAEFHANGTIRSKVMTRLEMSKSIWTLNFDDISKSAATLLLLRVPENIRPPY